MGMVKTFWYCLDLVEFGYSQKLFANERETTNSNSYVFHGESKNVSTKNYWSLCSKDLSG